MGKAFKTGNHIFLSKATLHLTATLSLLLALALIPGFGLFRSSDLPQGSSFLRHATGSVVIMSSPSSRDNSPHHRPRDDSGSPALDQISRRYRSDDSPSGSAGQQGDALQHALPENRQEEDNVDASPSRASLARRSPSDPRDSGRPLDSPPPYSRPQCAQNQAANRAFAERTLLESVGTPTKPVSWFEDIFASKANRKPVPPLWKSGPDGKPMRLNESEFDVWMKRFGDWLEAHSLHGLITFLEDIIILDSDQKPCFSFPGYAIDQQTVRSNIQLQRIILQRLSQHVWSIAQLPAPHDIDGLDDNVIYFQFRSLATRFQTIQSELNAAATPPGAFTTMYTDLFDNSFWRGHPLRVLAILAMLKNKMAQDLTGSAIEMLQHLLNGIETMAANPTIKIHDLGVWLDSVKNQYDIIVAKNAQITWSANNQIQSKLYDLFPVLCRLAKTSADYRLINGVTKLEAYFLHEDSADQGDRRSFEEFHHRTIVALQRFLPGAPSQKRGLGDMLELGSCSTAQQENKRPRLDSSSHDLIAAVAQAVTRAFMGATPTPSGSAPRFQGQQQQQRGSFQPGRGRPGGNRSRGGPQRNNQPQARRPEFPKRMCERCAMINPDHKEDNCPNPPDPNVADKLAKHKKYCNEFRKKAARARFQKSSSGTQALPSTGTGVEHTAHMSAAASFTNISMDDPASSLYLDDGDDSYYMPDHDCGFSAISDPIAPTTGTAPSFITMLLLVTAVSMATVTLAVSLPSLFGLPGFIVPSSSIITTFFLANLVILLAAICMHACHGTPPGSSSVLYYKLVPRQFAVVLLFLCLGSAFSGNAQGFAFTSHHNLTVAGEDHLCWIDSACTKSIFRSKDLLLNVRKLKEPHCVRGSVSQTLISMGLRFLGS